MVQLPAVFTERTHQLMGAARFERYLQAFEEEPPVSIRLNPLKTDGLTVAEGERVPWCTDGWYLPRRPNFTADPLLHAGCYYVQEAASMFLDEVLRQHLPTSLLQDQEALCLDMCAAPGGKSTLLRAAIPSNWTLYSNEPNRQRASILAENMQKWGYPRTIVTNHYPQHFRKSPCNFDLILCDVPCSGEGMFRKDHATISQWSPQHVEQCSLLQREIIDHAWACLRHGGLLIYSTCTFNTMENEENIRWLLTQHPEATTLPVNTNPEWGITGSLLTGFHHPVYRFIPGSTRSEGLFVCVLRKGTTNSHTSRAAHAASPHPAAASTPLPRIDVDYPQAIQYLRREAITLPPDAPRGLVEICFQGHPLGPAKNIGSRANNLYPKNWRIKTTHIPTQYEAILRHT